MTTLQTDGTIQQQIAEARDQAEHYHRAWQRARADLQNFKREAIERQQEEARRAGIALIQRILPIRDELAQTLDEIGDEQSDAQSWIAGLHLILRKLDRALLACGLEEKPADSVTRPAE